MGANTSVSVLLDRQMEVFIDIVGPQNASHRQTSDYVRLSIPDVALVTMLYDIVL